MRGQGDVPWNVRAESCLAAAGGVQHEDLKGLGVQQTFSNTVSCFQAMKDEVAAFAEVAPDRRAVQAKAAARRAATATKRLGQRIGIGVRRVDK